MNIFLDTNVILESTLRREGYEVTRALYERIRHQDGRMFISGGSFYSMIYVVDNFLRKHCRLIGDERINTLRVIMTNILYDLNVIGSDKDDLLQSINDVKFKDIEDSCQYQTAVKAGCDFLITFNIGDYPVDDDAVVRVLTPQQYLDLETLKE